jgi:hypothetical protein
MLKNEVQLTEKVSVDRIINVRTTKFFIWFILIIDNPYNNI